MTPPRIYADYNGIVASPRDPSRRAVVLDTFGTLRDLSNAGLRLHEGLVLVVHDASDDDEDLENEATVVWDPERRWWCAEFHGEIAYVPARDRTSVDRVLCIGCRADLSPIHQRLRSELATGGGACPTCGTRIDAAFAPPES